MYQSDELFQLENFQSGQLIRLTTSKKMFLLLSSNILADIRTGQEMKNINVVQDYVKAVYNNIEDKNVLAIRLENKLYKYDSFKHNEQLAIFKRVNKLYTAEELEKKLLQEKLFLDVHKLIYKKTKARIKLLENKTIKIFKGQYAQEILKKRVSTYEGEGLFKKYVDSDIVSLNCLIEKIIIDEQENLFLYRYQLSPYLL